MATSASKTLAEAKFILVQGKSLGEQAKTFKQLDKSAVLHSEDRVRHSSLMRTIFRGAYSRALVSHKRCIPLQVPGGASSRLLDTALDFQHPRSPAKVNPNLDKEKDGKDLIPTPTRVIRRSLDLGLDFLVFVRSTRNEDYKSAKHSGSRGKRLSITEARLRSPQRPTEISLSPGKLALRVGGEFMIRHRQ